MGALRDLTGAKFGRLIVHWPAGRTGKSPVIYWLCSCSCGRLKAIRACSLGRKNVNSCGCLATEVTRARSITHGESKSTRYILWQSAKYRAKKAGIPFDISVDDITIPKRCPLLGILLRCGTTTQSRSSPTLDRIKPLLGYVKGNIQVISYKANTVKNDLSIEDMRMLLRNWEAMEEEWTRLRKLNSFDLQNKSQSTKSPQEGLGDSVGVIGSGRRLGST